MLSPSCSLSLTSDLLQVSLQVSLAAAASSDRRRLPRWQRRLGPLGAARLRVNGRSMSGDEDGEQRRRYLRWSDELQAAYLDALEQCGGLQVGNTSPLVAACACLGCGTFFFHWLGLFGTCKFVLD